MLVYDITHCHMLSVLASNVFVPQWQCQLLAIRWHNDIPVSGKTC